MNQQINEQTGSPLLDVIVAGELNVDMILNHIDGFPELGKEILSHQFTLTLGSSSAICACNLSTLGTAVGFIGKLGTDNFAELIRDTFHERGVHTNLLLQSSEFNTGITIVLNYDQDRAMVTYPGAMEHLNVEEITDNSLNRARHLHVSSVFLQPLLKRDLVPLFTRAKKLGLSTSLDAQWDPFEKWDLDLKELLPHVDVFLPNEKEFKLLTATDDLESGFEKIRSYCHIVAVKNGQDGSFLWNDGNLMNIPAYLNEDVADCIGAGDSFNAGFLHQFVRGRPLEECAAFGNLTGAINTTRPGGTTAFDTLENVKETASKKFAYSFASE